MVDFMPYAQALFEVATEAQKDVSIGQEIQELAEVWSSNQELVQVFKHPKVKREEKKELLQKFAGLQPKEESFFDRFKSKFKK